MFATDEFDWAFGELLELFERANRRGIYPHELDPQVFHDAWYALNRQPFPVCQLCHGVLMSKITRPLHSLGPRRAFKKRYAYVLPH
jgi:hypothetical protein